MNSPIPPSTEETLAGGVVIAVDKNFKASKKVEVTTDSAPATDTPSGLKQDIFLVPPHNHDDTDSNKFRAWNLLERREVFCFKLPGTSPATAGNYGAVFIAMEPCFVRRVWEVHSTIGSDGAAVGLNLEKLTGTTAPGSGVVMLSADFSLKATINTVQKGTLLADRTKRSLGVGDRLGLKLSGTPTAVAGLLLEVEVEYI